MLRRLRPFLVSLSALLPACDDPSDPPGADVETIELREEPLGPKLNTSVIGNSAVPGVDTRGQVFHGVTLVDVELLGIADFFSIDPYTLRAEDGTVAAELFGNVVEGPQFLGSRWTFEVGNDTITAQITAIETSAAAGLYQPLLTSDLRKLDPDRLVYTFKWEGDDDLDHDVCPADGPGGARMVIYGDIDVNHKSGDITPRPDTLYFGCLSSAVGKAALWGYAPDSPSLTSVPLPAFETATRLVRNDYCADGIARTKVGKQVILRDRWGLNQFPAPLEPSFNTEAVWTAGGGATCLSRLRLTGGALLGPVVCPDAHVIPTCVGDMTLADQFTNNGYGHIWSKIPPA